MCCTLEIARDLIKIKKVFVTKDVAEFSKCILLPYIIRYNIHNKLILRRIKVVLKLKTHKLEPTIKNKCLIMNETNKSRGFISKRRTL